MKTFEQNSTLEGVLQELVIPAVSRKDMALRKKGLVCLGLLCLIARVSHFDLIHSLFKRSFALEHGLKIVPLIPKPSVDRP